MTRWLLRELSEDSGDRHVNQPLGLCSALLSREEEKGGEGGEQRMGRGIRWVLQNTRPKMGKLFWSVAKRAAGFGGGWWGMIKTSVLSEENPLFRHGSWNRNSVKTACPRTQTVHSFPSFSQVCDRFKAGNKKAVRSEDLLLNYQVHTKKKKNTLHTNNPRVYVSTMHCNMW